MSASSDDSGQQVPTLNPHSWLCTGLLTDGHRMNPLSLYSAAESPTYHQLRKRLESLRDSLNTQTQQLKQARKKLAKLKPCANDKDLASYEPGFFGSRRVKNDLERIAVLVSICSETDVASRFDGERLDPETTPTKWRDEIDKWVIPLSHVGWDVPQRLLDEVETQEGGIWNEVSPGDDGTGEPGVDGQREAAGNKVSEVQGLTWRLQLERLKLNDLTTTLRSAASIGRDLLEVGKTTETEAAKLRQRLREITDRRIRLLDANSGVYQCHLQDEALHHMWEARQDWEVALSEYTAQLADSVRTNTLRDKSPSRLIRPSPDLSGTPTLRWNQALPIKQDSSRYPPVTPTSRFSPQSSSSSAQRHGSTPSSTPDTLASIASIAPLPSPQRPLTAVSSTQIPVLSTSSPSLRSPAQSQIRESLATRMRRNPVTFGPTSTGLPSWTRSEVLPQSDIGSSIDRPPGNATAIPAMG
ncbi:hypothetical protein EHS25_009478 [Saitozyma podzolica]|uniref:Uncharacterized protein n=1 Tax=Saitozyma podzolica TaxID=1890683 RepID=A0A427YJE0_9TREE|nr:hypothetical protein EHS25_009478 [Saitozyma podzolica]